MKSKKQTGEDWFKAMLDRAMGSDQYWFEAAKIELAEQIYIAMRDLGVTEAELARRMGVSRAYVNKVLKGAANLTIESMVKIGRSLGREFKFSFDRVKDKVEVVLDTEYIYEIDEKISVSTDPRRNKHQNVFDFAQYKLGASKDLSAIINGETVNARSELAA